MDDIDYVVLSDISEINPPTDMHRLDDNTFVSFIPMADVSESGEWINQQARLLKDVRNGYTYFQEGDILFAKITPCMENGKGAHAVNLLNGIGFGTTEFHVLRAKSRAHPRFIYHWIMNEELRRKAEARMTGSAGQRRVPASFLREFKVPFLPLPEQRCIAETLDTIDEAIQKTEVLISKLKAMKQGLLHDLLTRGLDKNGKLRDPKAHPEQFKNSPFGLVPVDWNVVNLGVLSTFITSGSRGWASLYSNQGALFLRISNLTREHVNLRLDDVRYVLPPPMAAEGKRTRVGEGDLLISITADLGIIGVIPDGLGEAYVNQHIALVRLDRKSANPYWVANYLAFGASQKQFYMLNDQGAKAGINLPTVESLLVAVPEIQEQDRIAALIAAHDARIRTEEQYRDKLKLQKKGLMHDLLTGKVRIKV